MDIYSERAILVALLTRTYDAHLAIPSDAEPGFTYVCCIHFPWGQATWHIADDDAVKWFQHLPIRDNDWDGHTTIDKYARMSAAITLGETR
jgi:hypothetical protein